MNQVLITEIKPGIRLHYIPAEQFKTVSVSVHFHRPLCREEAANNALLTSVMGRGNRNLTDMAAIGRYMQSLYGATFSADVSRKGEDQILSFSVNVVEDSFLPDGETVVKDAATFLFDMIFCPQIKEGAFREDYVSQEKINLINDIEAQINDKRSYAVWRLIENMCAGDHYAVYELGDVDSVKEITAASLYAHYLKVLSDSPIDIFVTGKADSDSILKMTKERFASVSPKETRYPQTDLFVPTGAYREVEERYDISQAKLSMGFYTGIAPTEEQYADLMVFNSVFGSGAHSKLFNNVREKLSLCYYASSRLERFKGIMLVSSGIELENREKAENEILAQLKAMQDGDISDYEMEVSIKSIVNALRTFKDSAGALTNYYLGQAVTGTLISLEEQCKLISAVTKERVIRIAKQIKPEMVYVMRGEN